MKAGSIVNGRTSSVLAADAAYRAATLALRQNRPEEAIALTRTACRSYPDDARLWQILGLAHRKLDDLEPALAALEAAAARAPEDALIAHALARSTLEAGLPASSSYERACALAPTDPALWLGRAAALFAEGQAQVAIEMLDSKLAEDPAWLLGHVTAARLRWMCGKRDSFVASFDRALALAPRRLDLWAQLAGTLMQARLYEEAKSVIARAHAVVGDSPILISLEAACFAEQGETAMADRLFVRLPRPLDAATAESWVRHLLRSGRPQEAAVAAEPRTTQAGAEAFWPYVATAWRLTGDPRWAWLEGDDRFVGVYDIGDKLGSLEALATCLRRLHLATHQPLDQSLRGGTQTDGPLFARMEPEIRGLRAAILETVMTYIEQLPPSDPKHPLLGVARTPVRFSGSWSVRLTDGGHHANHVHPAGWISSAFYVALPQTMGDNAQSGWLALGEADELGLDLSPLRVVEPKPGRLVLFPSTMWHGTRPFSVGERLTVAFDVARPD